MKAEQSKFKEPETEGHRRPLMSGMKRLGMWKAGKVKILRFRWESRKSEMSNFRVIVLFKNAAC